MEKTTKKKVKKAILGVTSVALVAGVTSALTMAMLSDVDNAENTFTATPNLSVQQVEPKWDGTNASVPGGMTLRYMDRDGETKQKYNGGDVKGETTAKNYVPNSPIAKNPFAVNTSDSDEYVALRVYYQVLCRRDDDLPFTGAGCCGTDHTSWHTIKPDEFKKYFAQTSYNGSSTNYNDGDFYKVISTDGYAEYYYYSSDNGAHMMTLPSGYATPEIFDAVTPVESLNRCTESAHADHHMFRVTDCTGCQAGRYVFTDKTTDGGSLKGKGGDEIVLAVGDDDGLPEFRIVVQTAAIQTTYVNDSNDGTELSNASTVQAELAKCFPAVPDKDQAT